MLQSLHYDVSLLMVTNNLTWVTNVFALSIHCFYEKVALCFLDPAFSAQAPGFSPETIGKWTEQVVWQCNI